MGRGFEVRPSIGRRSSGGRSDCIKRRSFGIFVNRERDTEDTNNQISGKAGNSDLVHSSAVVFFTLLDSVNRSRSLHTLTTPPSLSTAPAAPARSLKFEASRLHVYTYDHRPRADTTWTGRRHSQHVDRNTLGLTQGMGEKL